MDSNAREAMEILAYLYLQHGKPHRALVLYQSLAEAFPRDGRIRLGWAMASMETGQLIAARQILDIWPEALTRPQEFFLLQSKVLSRMGQHARAKVCLLEYFRARGTV